MITHGWLQLALLAAAALAWGLLVSTGGSGKSGGSRRRSQ